MPGKVARACAVAGLLNGHGGKRCESFGQRFHNRRARRRDQFHLKAGRINWRTFQQFHGGGSRYRKNPVHALHCSPPHVQGRADNFIYAQRFRSNRCANDVYHRVYCAHFMEVDFFDVAVVDLGFSGSQRLEDSNCCLLCTFADTCLTNNLADLFQTSAMFMLAWRGRPRRPGFGSRRTVIMLP